MGTYRAARGALFAAVVTFALSSAGCEELEPETGELRMACVDADSDPTKAVVFATDIRPLMNGDVQGTKGCKGCHYASATAAPREGFFATNLDLEKLRTIRLGGRNTPPERIIVPGKPCSSALVQKLQGTFGNARMPRGSPYWEPAQIQLVIDWIAEGAQGGDDE